MPRTYAAPKPRGAPSPSAITHRRHRADYCRPPPTGLRTAYILWVGELVEHFGAAEVAKWDRTILLPLGDRIMQLLVNGRRYFAWSSQPGESEWLLFAGARLESSRRQYDYRARQGKPRCSCNELSITSHRIIGGRVIARSPEFDEICAAAVEHAPAMPPRGWTFDDWRMRGSVPKPLPPRRRPRHQG